MSENRDSFLPVRSASLMLLAIAYDMVAGTFFKATNFHVGVFCLLAVVLILWPFQMNSKKLQQWIRQLKWGAALILLGVLVFVIAERSVFLVHDLPQSFSCFVKLIASLLGMNIWVNEAGILSIQQVTGGYEVSVTAEKFGVSVLLALSFWIWMASAFVQRLRSRFVFLLLSSFTLLVYAVVRFIVITVIAKNMNWLAAYWNPLLMAVTFYPLTYFLDTLMLEFSLYRVSRKKEQRHIHLNNYSLAFTIIAIALFIFTYWYIPHGKPTAGKVLIDDSHSDWEWSTETFDQNSYGQRAVYNYYCFRDLLSRYWSTQVNTHKTLDQLDLSKYGVLILKTPTKPYSDREVHAIAGFVENGGGVWLIGDHTNLFGMSAYLNKVGELFGISFEYDDQFALTTSVPTTYSAPFLWKHPIISGMKDYGFLTSCTITAPFGSDVMIGKGMGVEYVDYGHVNFFGNIKPDADEKWGSFRQMVALSHGKGRVAAFADSTSFSNFCMFHDFKPLLAVNSVSFLNQATGFYGQHIMPWFKWVSPWLLLIVGLLWLLAPLRIPWFIGGFSLFSLIGIAACSYLSSRSGMTPYRETSDWVQFDQKLSRFRLPTMLDAGIKDLEDPGSFDMFFLNFYKIGYEPYLNNPLNLKGNPFLKVIINPQAQEFDETVYSKLTDWVSEGNRLLIVTDLNQPGQFHICRELLEKADYSCQITHEHVQKCVFEENAHIHHRLAVANAKERLKFNSELDLGLTCVSVGTGELFILDGGRTFSRLGLGPVYKNTSQEQRALCELNYALIDYISDKVSVDFIIKKAEIYIELKKESSKLP